MPLPPNSFLADGSRKDMPLFIFERDGAADVAVDCSGTVEATVLGVVAFGLGGGGAM